jgi:hypothetical protein
LNNPGESGIRNSSEYKGGKQLKKLLAIGAVMALVGVMAAPMAALADSAVTEVSGTFTKTATVTKPTDVAFPPLVVGVNSGNSVTPGSVVANVLGWSLTVTDSKATTAGYMTLGGLDVDADKLASPLTLCNASGGVFGTIAEYQAQLRVDSNHGQAGTMSIPLYVKQTVASTDKAGAYKITVTFTATPGS